MPAPGAQGLLPRQAAITIETAKQSPQVRSYATSSLLSSLLPSTTRKCTFIGAYFTEYAPGTQPEPGNFPARNRLISGLALAVLVAEAPADSGALITARFAAEQGRDVLAVPGNITARSSAGTNRLIQDGARLVLEAADVLAELNLHLVPQQMELRAALPENATEGRLLDLLAASDEPLHADELCRASGFPVAEVSGTLVMLELKGLVRQLAPMTYARVR